MGTAGLLSIAALIHGKALGPQRGSGMTKYAKTAGEVIGLKGLTTHGNVVTGTRHMVSAGHHAAAHAGFLDIRGGWKCD